MQANARTFNVIAQAPTLENLAGLVDGSADDCRVSPWPGGPFDPRPRLTQRIITRRSHLLGLVERRRRPVGEEADEERRREALASAQRHDRHSAELASQVEISIPQSK